MPLLDPPQAHPPSQRLGPHPFQPGSSYRNLLQHQHYTVPRDLDTTQPTSPTPGLPGARPVEWVLLRTLTHHEKLSDSNFIWFIYQDEI